MHRASLISLHSNSVAARGVQKEEKAVNVKLVCGASNIAILIRNMLYTIASAVTNKQNTDMLLSLS